MYKIIYCIRVENMKVDIQTIRSDLLMSQRTETENQIYESETRVVELIKTHKTETKNT
jgi:hypothetical protein